MKYKSKYFSKDKMRWCPCGCGMDVEEFVLRKFDLVRDYVGFPIHINSGARCDEYNAKIGGVKNSAHTRGTAMDVRFDNEFQKDKILWALGKVGCVRIGVNYEKKFIHGDFDLKLPSPAFWIY